MKNNKIEIVLEQWQYECADGCCTDYGTRIKLNGKELPHPSSTEEYYISNMYVGDDVILALASVLKGLGYDNVEIFETHENS